MRSDTLFPVDPVKTQMTKEERKEGQSEKVSDTAQAAPVQSLTEQQLAAIAHFAKGLSITAVANAIGVDRSTVHRWVKDPAFAAERERLKQERYEQLATRTLFLADEALAVVESVMNQAWQDRDRLAAAKIILKMLVEPE